MILYAIHVMLFFNTFLQTSILWAQYTSCVLHSIAMDFTLYNLLSYGSDEKDFKEILMDVICKV